MLRLQQRLREERAKEQQPKRKLAPDYNQRLKALKAKGTATNVHPKDMPRDSKNYQRWRASEDYEKWARMACTCPTDCRIYTDDHDASEPPRDCPVHGPGGTDPWRRD